MPLWILLLAQPPLLTLTFSADTLKPPPSVVYVTVDVDSSRPFIGDSAVFRASHPDRVRMRWNVQRRWLEVTMHKPVPGPIVISAKRSNVLVSRTLVLQP